MFYVLGTNNDSGANRTKHNADCLAVMDKANEIGRVVDSKMNNPKLNKSVIDALIFK